MQVKRLTCEDCGSTKMKTIHYTPYAYCKQCSEVVNVYEP